MRRIISYMCKKCWHSWTTEKKFDKCPKCKSTDIDKQESFSI